MDGNGEQRSNLDLLIIASSNDLDRLQNTLKHIPKVDNIFILENKKSENGEESLTLVNQAGPIHHYLWKWNDTHFHFANARNKVLSLSKNEWIFWLDCDDSLHPDDCEWINKILPTYDESVGGIMFGCSGLAFFEDCTLDELKNIPGMSVENWGYWSSPTIRLLRREIAHWTGRVHEQVLNSILLNNKKMLISDVMVKHRGYVTTLDTYIKKMERNKELLELELKENTEFDAIYMEYLDSTSKSLEGLLALRETKQKRDSA